MLLLQPHNILTGCDPQVITIMAIGNDFMEQGPSHARDHLIYEEWTSFSFFKQRFFVWTYSDR